MKIELSDHFTYKKLFNLTIAPILMMVFISLYSLSDGLIIANMIDNNAFAGSNLIWPITLIVGGIGFMFGTGGAALTSKRLGKKHYSWANNAFTNSIIAAVAIGIILSVVCYFITEPVAYALGNITNGTTQEMIDCAIQYGKILVFGQVAYILQNMFNSFFVVDEKPVLGFIFSLGAGITNVVGDIVFIKCGFGVVGASIATVLGFVVGGVGPIIYFLTHKNGTIRLVRPKLEMRSVLKSAGNGMSEFVNNVAMSIVSIVFNIQALIYFNQMGVEAYGVIQTIILIFIAIFIGYADSVAPAISYNYGAKNMDEVKNILRKSLNVILITSIIMLALGELLSEVFAGLFSSNPDTIALTTYAIRIWSIHFLFAGFVIYFSSFFTALNNGVTSAIIAFSHASIQIVCAFVLPLIFGESGLWWTAAVGEFIGLVIAIILLLKNKKRYRY